MESESRLHQRTILWPQATLLVCESQPHQDSESRPHQKTLGPLTSLNLRQIITASLNLHFNAACPAHGGAREPGRRTLSHLQAESGQPIADDVNVTGAHLSAPIFHVSRVSILGLTTLSATLVSLRQWIFPTRDQEIRSLIDPALCGLLPCVTMLRSYIRMSWGTSCDVLVFSCHHT